MKRTPLRKKRKKKSELEKLHQKAWKLHSEYVRRKSKGICFTCGSKKNWQELDTGHYIHGRLDYDFINTNAQCIYCNRYLHGNLGRYAERLLTLYGEKELRELRLRANQIKKYIIEELQEIIKDREAKIRELDGQRH